MTERFSPSYSLFSAGEAAAMVGGSCKGNLRALVTDVVADSRRAGPGALFVALRGERADGSDFVAQAFRSGAACAFVDASRRDAVLASLSAEAAGFADRCVVFVDSPLAALQALAAEHRRRMTGLCRIGVTGSSGKTTTKECIGAVLSAAFPSGTVAVNSGNLNSDIGLALALFSIRPSHRYGVFEMGMNRSGEMDELASMYEPDIGVITNIGTAHIGILGSRHAIAEEKKKIFSRFDGRQTGFIPEDGEFSEFLAAGVKGELKEFGASATPGIRKLSFKGLEGWHIGWKGAEFAFPLPGRHNLMNALAALSVADHLGIDPEAAARGLAGVKPLFGRSEIVKAGVTVVRDCYNANPDSIAAAVEFCDSVDWPGRRIYVLGSMLELGAESRAAHEDMGRLAAASAADHVLFFGQDAEAAMSAASRSASARGPALYHTNDISDLIRKLRSVTKRGDLVLVKASRGMELERVVEPLVADFAADAGGEEEDAHAS